MKRAAAVALLALAALAGVAWYTGLVDRALVDRFVRQPEREDLARQLETPASYSGRRELDFSPFEAGIAQLGEARVRELDALLGGADIVEIQGFFERGRLSSEELVLYYLRRIRKYDGQLRSVTELDPDAAETARALDAERARGGARGLMHGIPVLVKDNIATGGALHTTAGAKALEGLRTDRDAFLVRRLREAGAVVLGKSALSEWANYMSSTLPNGFSSVGGQVRNPYGEFDVSGSSSGSAVAVAASFVTAAVGTETWGSLISPASQNSVVAVKPTVGLVSRHGIIPMVDAQDTAGPMTRNVTDAAILLDALSGEDANDPTTLRVLRVGTSYRGVLDEDGLRDRRVGVVRLRGYDDEMLHGALEVLEQCGAELVELPPISLLDLKPFRDDFFVLANRDFPRGVGKFLDAMKAPVRSLAEVIAFNAEDPGERAPFGQDMLGAAQASSATDAEYREASARSVSRAREWIDGMLADRDLEMLVAMGSSFFVSYPPAGYPAVSVPAGYRESGEPVGLSFIGGFLGERALLRAAFSFEQKVRARRAPKAVGLDTEASEADPGPEPPNILVLMAEDMGPRVGAFGDPLAVTPHIDRLASEGVRYPNTFTTAGVCAPSRAAHITGVHQMALGAQHMRSFQGGYRAVPPPEVKAYPELLRAAGYHTFTQLKLDYQFSKIWPGSGPFTIWDREGRFRADWREREPDQPFFGLVNFHSTHESGVFPRTGFPKSGTHLLFQLIYRITFWGHHDVVAARDVPVPPYYPDTPTVRRDIARHYNNIHKMDEEVGALLEALDRDGLSDSTIVIWTTDHGDGLPRAKREVFDSGIRVPMIVRWPDALRPAALKAGGEDPRLVSFVDLAPTILAMAGIRAPDYMVGRDFTADDPAGLREYIYAAKDRMDEFPDRQRAVRDRRFKYIRNYHPQEPGATRIAYRQNLDSMEELWSFWESGSLDAAAARWFEPRSREELYDTRDDPHELVNLAEDPAHAPTLDRMRDALDAWLAATEDRGAIPEAELAELFWPGGVEPITPPPSARVKDVGTGRVRVALDCSEPGASLGYRLGGGHWRLYSEALELPEGGTLTAKAVRYGWRESEEVQVDLGAPASN